jgi:hypothetical protein
MWVLGDLFQNYATKYVGSAGAFRCRILTSFGDCLGLLVFSELRGLTAHRNRISWLRRGLHIDRDRPREMPHVTVAGPNPAGMAGDVEMHNPAPAVLITKKQYRIWKFKVGTAKKSMASKASR